MVDVAKLLMMAEELLIVAWNQANELEKAKLSTALEIVKDVRVQRQTTERN